MAVQTQIEYQIANDLTLMILDRVRAYAHRRAVALRQAARATSDKAEQERLKGVADEFEHLSKTFGALTDPDAIQD